MTLFLVLLGIGILFALRARRNSAQGGRSFSDELYDYSMKSKGKIRNPHMSMRAMRHRMMKKR